VQPDIVAWLASDHGFFVQVGVFVLLVLGGLGLPIPEDIPILLGGVAAAKNIVQIRTMFLICYLGVMVGDQIMFFIGYHFGQRLLDAGTRSRFFPAITQNKVNEVRDGLRKRRLLFIFMARHLFPIRSVTFIAAGALRIPYFEFLAADAIAAFVSVGVVLFIGHWLGQRVTPEMVQHFAHAANFYIVLGVLIIVLALLLHFRLKHKSPRNETSAAQNQEDKTANGY